METVKPPVVIPMWLTGFDKLMPEGRAVPYKYLPRPGAQLSVTFGDPIPSDVIQGALKRIGRPSSQTASATDLPAPKGWMGDQVTSHLQSSGLEHEDVGDKRSSEILKVRADVTAIIHDSVEALGRSVCGDTLSRMYAD